MKPHLPALLLGLGLSTATVLPAAAYPVDILVQATDRAGLLRDISELFAREKMPVVGLHSDAGKEISHMMITVQVSDTHRLNKVLGELAVMEGVMSARRR